MAEEFKVIDENQLESLRELNEPGEDDIVTELIDIFISHTPDTISQLRDNIQKQNRDEVGKLAHKLKGSCSNLGAELMRSKCLYLEENADSISWEEINKQFEAIEAAYSEVADILTNKWRKPAA